MAVCNPRVVGLGNVGSIELWDEVLGLIGNRKVKVKSYIEYARKAWLKWSYPWPCKMCTRSSREERPWPNGDPKARNFPRGDGDGGQNLPEVVAGTRTGNPRPRPRIPDIK
ncbi:hypothetical protein PIB30_070654 [Stylosanthes scabra]|uniref:Uncharacterized protein n=1 Tax=Stylosanthes scabra TaxID=79078 RepID=A0ABU6QN46_9FABA|nr:hypothetical protein [Stylosanthes scabra]